MAIDDNVEYLDSLRVVFQPYRKDFKLIKCINEVGNQRGQDEMFQQIRLQQPDIILMDMSFTLQGKSHDYGIKLTQMIQNQFPEQKIIMLVSDSEEEDERRWEKIRRSFEAGARAYLSKRDTPSWMEAINEVVHGDAFVSKSFIKTIVNGLRNKLRKNRYSQKLGKRQLEVLMQLAQDKSLQEVADSLQKGKGEALSIHTVNFHLRNIRVKLNVRTIHGLMAKAFREHLLQ